MGMITMTNTDTKRAIIHSINTHCRALDCKRLAALEKYIKDHMQEWVFEMACESVGGCTIPLTDAKTE